MQVDLCQSNIKLNTHVPSTLFVTLFPLCQSDNAQGSFGDLDQLVESEGEGGNGESLLILQPSKYLVVVYPCRVGYTTSLSWN